MALIHFSIAQFTFLMFYLRYLHLYVEVTLTCGSFIIQFGNKTFSLLK